MKFIFYCLLSLPVTEMEAAPVATFAMVVDSHGSAMTASGVVRSGQLLPASSELSVPTDAPHVDLQLTGDATYAPADSRPLTGSRSETLIRVEPGSTLSLSKLEATETGIETMRQIELRLIKGSVLISARRVRTLSTLNLYTPVGRVNVSEGTVEISGKEVAVAHGRVVFYPADITAASAPVVLTSGQFYDTSTHKIASLSSSLIAAMDQKTATFHPVGPAHFSSSEDHTEDCISPIHPGHHHHHHHHPPKNGPPQHAPNNASAM